MKIDNFGLTNGILFFTTGGTFASNAWIDSGGKNCGGVLGNRFEAFTADDGKSWDIGRDTVYPVEEEQLEELLQKAHPAFQLVVHIWEHRPKKCPISFLLDLDNVGNYCEQVSVEATKEYFAEKYKIEF